MFKAGAGRRGMMSFGCVIQFVCVGSGEEYSIFSFTLLVCLFFCMQIQVACLCL